MDINLTDTSKGTTVSSATVSSWKKQQHQSQTRPTSTDAVLKTARFARDACSPCDIYRRRGDPPQWCRCCRPRGRGGGGAPLTRSAQTRAAAAANTNSVERESAGGDTGKKRRVICFIFGLGIPASRLTWAPGCSSPRGTSVSRGGEVSSHSLEPSRLM